LLPILALCGDENGDSLLGLTPDEEDTLMEEAAEFIPNCVIAVAAYWRAKGRSKSRCRSPSLHHHIQNALQPRLAAMIPVLADPAKSSRNAAAKPRESPWP
jgi:hypothetical protein